MLASGNATVVLSAVRALMEGAPVSLELVARVSGKSVRYLTSIAERENWNMPQLARQEEVLLEHRLMILADRMIREMEDIGLSGIAEQYDKQRIDALSSMLKIVEKLDAVVFGQRHSAEKEIKNDAELAAALALVDARIMELACELAATMGGEEYLASVGVTNTV